MARTIKLFVRGGAWHAQDSDPQVRELFGTDVLPTPFLSAVPAVDVVYRISALNPDAIVTVIPSTLE